MHGGAQARFPGCSPQRWAAPHNTGAQQASGTAGGAGLAAQRRLAAVSTAAGSRHPRAGAQRLMAPLPAVRRRACAAAARSPGCPPTPCLPPLLPLRRPAHHQPARTKASRQVSSSCRGRDCSGGYRAAAAAAMRRAQAATTRRPGKAPRQAHAPTSSTSRAGALEVLMRSTTWRWPRLRASSTGVCSILVGGGCTGGGGGGGGGEAGEQL